MSRREIPINESLEKCRHFDKDIRIIALSDLYNTLESDQSLNPQTAQKVCDLILDRLEKDTSNDVQAGAVKCLSILMQKAQTQQIKNICNSLSKYLKDEKKKDLHDIYSIGLKTTIVEVPQASGQCVIDELLQPALTGIESDDMDQRTFWMELLREIINRFGEDLGESMDQILGSTLSRLDDEHQAVRKRASGALGVLSAHLNDQQFNDSVSRILKEIDAAQKSKKMQNSRLQTYVQTISTIARHSGFRLAPLLAQIVPKLLEVIGNPSEMDEEQVDHDLIDNCIRTLESLVLKCANSVGPHLESILAECKSLVRYDPNFAYSMDDEGDEESDEDMDGDQSDMEELVDEDEDDSSWKIRRSAVQLIAASVSCRPDLLDGIVSFCFDTLLESVFEREETVRTEIYSCLKDIFEQCIRIVGKDEGHTPAVILSKAGSIPGIDSDATHGAESTDHVSFLQAESAGTIAADAVSADTKEKICTAVGNRSSAVLEKLLKAFQTFKGSQKSTECILQTLRKQIIFRGLRSEASVKSVFDACYSACQHSASPIVVNGICLLIVLFEHSDQNCTRKVLKEVCRLAVEKTNSDWYKVVSYAFALLNRVILTSTDKSEVSPIAEKVQELLGDKTKIQDIDILVKQSLTSCATLICWKYGNHYPTVTNQVFVHLTTALRSEMMRLSALKCLNLLCCASWNIDFGNYADENNQDALSSIVSITCQLLKQRSWQLRKQSLNVLESMLTQHRDTVSADLLGTICNESAYMLEEHDTTLTGHALDLYISMMRSHPKGSVDKLSTIFGLALSIPEHSTVQNATMRSLVLFFSEYAYLFGQQAKADLHKGLDHMFQRVRDGHIQHYRWPLAAECVAAIISKGKETKKLMKQCVATVSKGDNSISAVCFNMLVLGELAQGVGEQDLETIAEPIWKRLQDEETKIRESAAMALGAICHSFESQLNKMLTSLGKGDASAKAQYSFLLCLRETLNRFLQDDSAVPAFLESHVSDLAGKLRELCTSSSEGHRAAMTDCLGYLMSLFPSKVFSELADMVNSGTPALQTVALTSLKNSLNYFPIAQFDPSVLRPFLWAITAESTFVQQAALELLNSLLHFALDKVKPWLVGEAHQCGQKRSSPNEQNGILPYVYDSCYVKDHLIRKVNLGPFTHKIDDGLNIRKAGAAVVVTLTKKVPQYLGEEAIKCVVQLLKDDESVRVYGYHAISNMATCSAMHGVLLNHLRPVVESLNTNFEEYTKNNNQSDTPRAAIRAVYNLSCYCPQVNNDVGFKTLLSDRLEKVAVYKEMFDAIRSEFRGQEEH